MFSFMVVAVTSRSSEYEDAEPKLWVVMWLSCAHMNTFCLITLSLLIKKKWIILWVFILFSWYLWMDIADVSQLFCFREIWWKTLKFLALWDAFENVYISRRGQLMFEVLHLYRSVSLAYMHIHTHIQTHTHTHTREHLPSSAFKECFKDAEWTDRFSLPRRLNCHITPSPSQSESCSHLQTRPFVCLFSETSQVSVGASWSLPFKIKHPPHLLQPSSSFPSCGATTFPKLLEPRRFVLPRLLSPSDRWLTFPGLVQTIYFPRHFPADGWRVPPLLWRRPGYVSTWLGCPRPHTGSICPFQSAPAFPPTSSSVFCGSRRFMKCLNAQLALFTRPQRIIYEANIKFNLLSVLQLSFFYFLFCFCFFNF